MSVTDEIEKLQAMRAAGTLSDEEFSRAKDKVLARDRPRPAPPRRRDRSGTSWALWILVVLVAAGAAGVLVMLDGISKQLELVVGCLGIVAACAGAVMSVMEDLSLGGTLAFVVIGVAIGAVVFAAMAPIVIVVALVCFPVVLLWGWISEAIGGG